MKGIFPNIIMEVKIKMYIKKVYGYVLFERDLTFIYKGLLDTYDPPTTESKNWKHWVAHITPTTCGLCRNLNGKIYSIRDIDFQEPPIHPNCRCEVLPMEAVIAGNATKDGKNGADFWMKYMGRLPDYYISEKDLKALGWKEGKSPKKFAPGRMMTRGIYQNRNKHLPDKLGRIWYEADINYYEGKRNGHRLLWSNDGLIFVTYDHYGTFYEII